LTRLAPTIDSGEDGLLRGQRRQAPHQLGLIELSAADPLAIVVAMKMENILRAERDGVVKAINAKPGDSLAVDAVIMEFA